MARSNGPLFAGPSLHSPVVDIYCASAEAQARGHSEEIDSIASRPSGQLLISLERRKRARALSLSLPLSSAVPFAGEKSPLPLPTLPGPLDRPTPI